MSKRKRTLRANSTRRRHRRQQAPPPPAPPMTDGPPLRPPKRKAFVVTQGYVIRPGKERYGRPRRWGKIEYAQAAIAMLFPDVLPTNVNALQLTDRVNDLLRLDPEYAFGPLDRMTVARAWDRLRKNNP